VIPLRPFVTIRRIEEDPRYGTFGVLLIQGSAFCVTLEPPWRMNARLTSCVPPGRYEAEKTHSAKFGTTYRLRDIPGRTNILLHPGNILEDTEGCILLASEFGKLRSRDRAILNSGKTFNLFIRAMEDYDVIDIQIIPPWA